MTETIDIAAQPKMTLEDLLIRCTDYEDMSLSMDARELGMLKQHILLLKAERQRNEVVRCEGVHPYVHEMIDLQETIDELRSEISKLKGEHVLVGYRNKFTGMIWNLEQQLGAETDPLVYEPVFLTSLEKPVFLPVGEIVKWSGTNRDKGITREVDFRFLRLDVKPGTKLYAIESAPAEKSDLLTRAEALAVETRALSNRIQAGE